MELPHPPWPFNNNIIKYIVYLGEPFQKYSFPLLSITYLTGFFDTLFFPAACSSPHLHGQDAETKHLTPTSLCIYFELDQRLALPPQGAKLIYKRVGYQSQTSRQRCSAQAQLGEADIGQAERIRHLQNLAVAIELGWVDQPPPLWRHQRSTDADKARLEQQIGG
jgi:hypothetical protein